MGKVVLEAAGDRTSRLLTNHLAAGMSMVNVVLVAFSGHRGKVGKWFVIIGFLGDLQLLVWR